METKYEGLELWNKVVMTKPGDTKTLKFGRKITTIDAYTQIKNFTEQFGACGVGWGYNSKIIEIPNHDICVVELTLWISGGREFTEFGTCEWMQSRKSGPDVIDPDAPKKANTDALTKAFSRIGFNADVFMGMFDDNKYVAMAQNEEAKGIAEKEKAEQDAAKKVKEDINIAKVWALEVELKIPEPKTEEEKSKMNYKEICDYGKELHGLKAGK